jgi:monovalent cation/hydrogen antiporter
MVTLELIILIGAAVLAGEVAARRFHLPPPLVLLAIGSGLSFLPGMRDETLPPIVVLFVFLPALIYWESLNNTSLREIRDNLRIIVLTAVGLALATTLFVAAAAHALGLTWSLATALGAIVALTDATTIADLLAMVQRRISAILRAESLINDGTSLVLYTIAVRAAVTGRQMNPAQVSAQFAESAVVSVAIGLAVGGLILWVRHYLTEERLASTLSLLTPFLAFLPAEQAHGSGVVAVATCGIVVIRGGVRIIPAAARRQAFGFWQVVSFVLNDALFVLIGLQLDSITDQLRLHSLPLALSLSGIVIGAVIGLRLLWFYTVPYLLRAIDRRAAQRALRIPARHRLFIAWAGTRGSISLALALALPLTTNAGRHLPHREVTITVTFAVIVFTTVVQGLSMPAVLRWSGLTPDPTQAYEEALANRTAMQRALAILPGTAAALGVPDVVRDRLAAEYSAVADELTSTMDDTTLTVTPTGTAEADWERQLRRAIVQARRRARPASRQAHRRRRVPADPGPPRYGGDPARRRHRQRTLAGKQPGRERRERFRTRRGARWWQGPWRRTRSCRSPGRRPRPSGAAGYGT